MFTGSFIELRISIFELFDQSYLTSVNYLLVGYYFFHQTNPIGEKIEKIPKKK